MEFNVQTQFVGRQQQNKEIHSVWAFSGFTIQPNNEKKSSQSQHLLIFVEPKIQTVFSPSMLLHFTISHSNPDKKEKNSRASDERKICAILIQHTNRRNVWGPTHSHYFMVIGEGRKEWIECKSFASLIKKKLSNVLSFSLDTKLKAIVYACSILSKLFRSSAETTRLIKLPLNIKLTL